LYGKRLPIKMDSMEKFTLHERLKSDTIFVHDLPLCRVLLMNDSNYPWFILVPKRDGATEMFELIKEDRIQLEIEVSAIARAIKTNFCAKKINIATLGNIVPQLHIHIVARFENDPSWPKPVWGNPDLVQYKNNELEALIESSSAIFKELGL